MVDNFLKFSIASCFEPLDELFRIRSLVGVHQSKSPCSFVYLVFFQNFKNTSEITTCPLNSNNLSER